MARISLLLLTASLVFQMSSGQKPDKNMVLPNSSPGLNALSGDSTAHPLSFRTGYSKPIFFPESLNNHFFGNEQLLHIRKLKGEVVAIPDGTGQVYQCIVKPDSIEFRRMDHTHYGGYNFGAYVFVHRDTLFSFGGYGFWKYNGLLRFYDERSGGWEIKPLQKEIPAHSLLNSIGQWIDQQEGSLYQISPNLHNLAHPYTDTTRIYRLSLVSRQWEELGTLTTDAISHLIGALKIAELPDGDLISCGPGGQTILLLNLDRKSVV